MNDKELFKSQALIYRDKIRQIRSLLKKLPKGVSVTDYPPLFVDTELMLTSEDYFNIYEERISQVIMHCNLALQYLREAEATRRKLPKQQLWVNGKPFIF